MTELNRQIFDVADIQIDPATRHSFYLLANATHSLLEVYDYPARMGLRSANRSSIIMPHDFTPVWYANQSIKDHYEIAATLPSLHKGHLINDVLYDFTVPEGAKQTGGLVVHSITRIVHPRSTYETAKKVDMRLTAGGVIRALAETIDKLRTGAPGWIFAIKS